MEAVCPGPCCTWDLSKALRASYDAQVASPAHISSHLDRGADVHAGPLSSQRGHHPLWKLSALLNDSPRNWSPGFLLMDKVSEEVLLPWDR